MIFIETHLFFSTVPQKDIKQTGACVNFLCGTFHRGDPPQRSKGDLGPELHSDGTHRRQGQGSSRCIRGNPAGPKGPRPRTALTLVPRCRLSASRRREKAGTGAAGKRPAGSSSYSKASFHSENGAVLPIIIELLKLEGFNGKKPRTFDIKIYTDSQLIYENVWAFIDFERETEDKTFITF